MIAPSPKPLAIFHGVQSFGVAYRMCRASFERISGAGILPGIHIHCNKADKQERSLRAFMFERGRMTYVVYWHTSGDGTLEIYLRGEKCRLMENLGKDLHVEKSKDRLRLPLGPKRYLACSGISRQEVIRAFQQGRVSL